MIKESTPCRSHEIPGLAYQVFDILRIGEGHGESCRRKYFLAITETWQAGAAKAETEEDWAQLKRLMLNHAKSRAKSRDRTGSNSAERSWLYGMENHITHFMWAYHPEPCPDCGQGHPEPQKHIEVQSSLHPEPDSSGQVTSPEESGEPFESERKARSWFRQRTSFSWAWSWFLSLKNGCASLFWRIGPRSARDVKRAGGQA